MVDAHLAKIGAILEEIRDEAYRRGYQDALDRIMATASSAAGEAARPLAPASMPAASNAASGKRMPKGAVRDIAHAVLVAHPQGLTIPLLLDRASATGTPVSGPSVRIALLKMEEEGVARREGRVWMLVEPPSAGDEAPSEPARDFPDSFAGDAPVDPTAGPAERVGEGGFGTENAAE